MGFVAPWLLLGLIAALIPIAIHWIGKKQRVTRPFSAVEFLLGSDEALLRRIRLYQLLLLVVRMLIIAALVLFVSRPFMMVESAWTGQIPEFERAVVILDDTMSMGRMYRGEPLFDEAKRRVRDYLETRRGRAEIALIGMVDPEQPLSTFTTEIRLQRDALDRIGLTSKHATVAASVQRALTLLDDHRDRKQGSRSVYLFSDMAEHGDLSAFSNWPSHIGRQLIPIGDDAGVPHNLAVTKLETQFGQEGAQHAISITATICSYNERAASPGVSLSIDEKIHARGVVQIASRACAQKTFRHRFEQSGTYRVAVSIDDERDLLPTDNVRRLILNYVGETRVLLVNGAPSPIPHDDALFYLRSALNVPSEISSPIVIRERNEEVLTKMPLDEVDVVMLVNVRGITPAVGKQLEAFVDRGGGVFIALGENVDPHAYNAHLKALLPQPLRSDPWGSERTVAQLPRLGWLNLTHPVFAQLKDGVSGAGLLQTTFRRYFLLDPTIHETRELLAKIEDGAPVMIARPWGKGRVILWVSTVDRTWTDFPIRPGFMPLMQETVRYLHGNRTVSTENTNAMDVKENANADPRESDLTRATQRERDTSTGHAPRAKQRLELWHGLGVLLLCFVLAESVLSFRR